VKLLHLSDNIVRDLQFALRTFARAPLASITIVVTVGLGLGLMTVLFSILNVFLFRSDQVPDVHEMFAVERPPGANDERPRFTRRQFERLQRETSVFAGAYAEMPDIDTRVDGRMMAITLVSGNAFEVMGVAAAMGRTLLPSDDDRTAPQPVIVLSHKGWERRFGLDPHVVGKSVIVSGLPHEVVGVMPEGFRGLSVSAPDVWAPLTSLADFRPIHRGREDAVAVDIAGRLKPGLTREIARAQLSAWDSPQSSNVLAESREAGILLTPKRGTIPQPVEALIVFAPLFFAFGLILLIGCANVANLLLARGVARQREIGVRLSLGATRRRIIWQLLTESLLLALVAALVGFFVSRIAIEATIAAVLSSMPPDIGDVTLLAPGADWRVVVFLIAGAVASTAFFGLMPALQATRIEPVRTIRGEVMRDARPGRSRGLLIGLQVGGSALLLICAAVFLRSALASSTSDPGFRTSDTLIVEVVNEPRRQALLQGLRAEPSVIGTAAAWPDAFGAPREALVQSGTQQAAIAYKFVSSEFFSVLDIPIVRGRTFSVDEGAGTIPVAIVSESAANTLWPGSDAVGQTLSLEPDPQSPTRRDDEPPLPARTLTVVGVARDVAGFRIADFEEAGIYVPTNANVAETGFIVRVNSDPELARQRLLDRLTVIDPNVGQVITMRTIARIDTYLLQVAFWVAIVLGTLALIFTVSGLFSVLSYLVEQRAKEIGVRIALGATSRNVTRLVLSQTARPVAVGLLAGAGLALALATLLVATPGAATIAEIVHVLDPVAYAGSLLLIVAACALAASIPAARAAGLDPMRTLRQD
jgi:predicted permease